MRSPLVAVVAALGLLAPAACSKDKGKAPVTEEARDDLPVMTIDEVAGALARGSCKPIDVNDDHLRRTVGVIPGAILLSDYEAFSLGELPTDKAAPLVFYCANEQCDASHIAARRARSAGYRDVHVLSAGIMGWAKAGRAVDKPAPTPPT